MAGAAWIESIGTPGRVDRLALDFACSGRVSLASGRDGLYSHRTAGKEDRFYRLGCARQGALGNREGRCLFRLAPTRRILADQAAVSRPAPAPSMQGVVTLPLNPLCLDPYGSNRLHMRSHYHMDANRSHVQPPDRPDGMNLAPSPVGPDVCRALGYRAVFPRRCRRATASARRGTSGCLLPRPTWPWGGWMARS